MQTLEQWRDQWRVVLSGSFVFMWWGTAADRYLRLPRPWSLAAVLTVLSGLMALLVLIVIPGLPVRLLWNH
jgi:hypothetical protein